MPEPPIFFLDFPQHHDLQSPGVYRVRGAALAIDGPRLETLTIARDGQVVAEMPIDRPCPELAPLNLPGAADCRFEADVTLDPAGEYTFSADGETLFLLTPPPDRARLAAIAAAVGALPAPPPDLVRTTQGGGDVASYIASAVSGLVTLEALCEASGLRTQDSGLKRPSEPPNAILDIGCGTGRLLLGWHAAGKTQLAGVDINPALIEWNREALPAVADWRVSNVEPPLAFPDASFDLIQLASVFTHLPLPLQRLWIEEFHRLLRPGGRVVITLHGSVYARVLLDPASQETFGREGYVEVAGAEPGANAFATFHAEGFARELFAGFESVRYLPRGNNPARPSLFPIAALQDVYLLTSDY
jgi:SAM-dependent methyltransferase